MTTPTTYLDKMGIARTISKVHFGQPYGLYSSRRWWSYLRDMKPEDRGRHIVEWYQAGLIDDRQLWDVLGSFSSPVTGKTAIEAYKALGFEPLAGFPLKKKEA